MRVALLSAFHPAVRLIVVGLLPLVVACTSDGRAEKSNAERGATQTATETAAQRATQSASQSADTLGLTLPAGLVAGIYARVPGARAMTLGPDGAVYVSQPGKGTIVRLVDANGDGVAESQTVAVEDLNRPHGMAFHDGAFYVANTDGVVRMTLNKNGVAQGKPVYVNKYSSGGGHWTRSIVFGADGKMYVSIGSSCNVCEEKNKDRAAVMQYNADGSGGRLYARGLRNAVGIAVYPPTRELWVTQNERDNLKPEHEDLPPEEINILRDGGDYGWPYCWGNRHPSPEFDNPGRCANTIPPALEMQAHSAPLGMAFLTNATQLPQAMRKDLLVAFHGSWNRKVPTGAKVVRVRIENNKPVGYDDFVAGWQRPDGTRWGRPVDVLVAKDGAILISDDAGGTVVRVARKR